jgi:hypothetical protein
VRTQEDPKISKSRRTKVVTNDIKNGKIIIFVKIERKFKILSSPSWIHPPFLPHQM